MDNIIEKFRRLGSSASFYLAYGNELGKEYLRDALDVFDANPDLQPQMRKVAVGFLWSIKNERPNKQQE